jgi:hypothetical protein
MEYRTKILQRYSSYLSKIFVELCENGLSMIIQRKSQNEKRIKQKISRISSPYGMNEHTTCSRDEYDVG